MQNCSDITSNMQLIVRIRLFQRPYTLCYISEEHFVLPHEQYYRSIGVRTGNCCAIQIEDDGAAGKKILKYTANAFFLQSFLKECMNSCVYRVNILTHQSKLCGYPVNGIVFLKLILVPPDKEIIDYSWNERILKLVWTRMEIENAFSWLSTLGGAYSALGDYFEHCAEEAGRISMRQYKLSRMLGDDGLAARSRLYMALSHSQKGKLHLSRHIVRNIAEFARATRDQRLLRMCQGVWAKLKYLRALKKVSTLTIKQNGSGESINTKNMAI